MKILSCALILSLSSLLLFSCGGEKPAQPSAGNTPGQPTLDAALLEISPNFNIERIGAQVGVWTSDFPAAEKLAAEKKLPILLYFTGSDWCKYCKFLQRDVLNQKEWQDWAADKLLLVYLDFPRNPTLISEDLQKQNSALQAKYQIEAFPTLMLLEHDGQRLGNVQLRENNTPQTFKRSLKQILRRREAGVKQMIARLPDGKREQVQALYDQINARKTKAEELSKKFHEQMQAMEKEMQDLSTETEKNILEAVIAQQTPENQQKYREARALLDDTEKQLQDWLKTEPQQNEQNILIYQNFQKILQEQSDIIADIIDPD
ncbi:MAG: thioredoxin fold domain-containing protein [Oligosphaeraceae bacterium]|nr:thioredoxin fold domain-containing protein [Oligosphaeraceae bacterium]